MSVVATCVFRICTAAMVLCALHVLESATRLKMIAEQLVFLLFKIQSSATIRNKQPAASLFSFIPILLFPQTSHLFPERLSTPIISFQDLSP